jgi:hypothetical protein
MASRCPCYGGVDLDVTLGHASGRSFGDSLAVGDVIACGAGVMGQSLAYDVSSRILVCDDPCVRILCYTGVLVVVNILWILCMYGVRSAYSLCHFVVSLLLF